MEIAISNIGMAILISGLSGMVFLYLLPFYFVWKGDGVEQLGELMIVGFRVYYRRRPERGSAQAFEVLVSGGLADIGGVGCYGVWGSGRKFPCLELLEPNI